MSINRLTRENMRRVLTALKRGVYCPDDLVDVLDIGKDAVYRAVEELLNLNRIYVACKFRTTCHGGRLALFYMAGNAQRKQRCDAILQLLSEADLTTSELATRMGVTGYVVRPLMAHLHYSRSIIHICGWKRNGTAYIPIWTLGRGEDAPKPYNYALPPKEKAVKPQVDPEEAIRRINAAKAAKIKPFRDPFVAALFGDVQRNT
jgi:hypothetical protein